MHDSSKIILFTNDKYGYKDGKGGDLWNMECLNSFNADYHAYEVETRKKAVQAALLVAASRVKGGSATLKTMSNFNVTRCTGDHNQLTIILRMRKARLQYDLDEDVPLTNNFCGARYQEAAECMALFNAVHTLVVRAQHETAMIAGYWYHWLCKAYAAVSGNEPMDVIDLEAITKSPTLPTRKLHCNRFTSLGRVFRSRCQMEFKRRYGLTGMKTGEDVTDDWEPTMTPDLGIPMLLDPRLCNNTRAMGLPKETRAKYLNLLHEAHYEWHINDRDLEVAALQQQHRDQQKAVADLEQRAAELAAEAILIKEEAAAAPLSPTPNETQREEDYDSDSGDCVHVGTPVAARIEPPPPTLPLLDKISFVTQSATQYRNFVVACRTMQKDPRKPERELGIIDWPVLYPAEYRDTGPGITAMKLWKVNLAPVINTLRDSDINMGFFLDMALYSRNSIASPQASSFCERCNSAAKIIMTHKTSLMLPRHVEQRVLLRMNRKYMAHMRKWYPELNGQLMHLLLASHNALMSQPPV
jgi:hypothetical protein